MRKFLLIPLLLLCLVIPLSAEPVISLSEAINSAMENNTDMEVARLTLQSSLRSASNVSSYIPNLSLTGSGTIAASTLGSTNPRVNQMDWYAGGNFSVGVSMNLGTSLIGSTALNNANATLARLTYATSQSTVEQSVTTSYWALVSAKRGMESAKRDLATVERTLENIRESYNAGLSTSLDLSRAELSVLNYDYALKQLENSYLLSKESFRILTGIEGDFDVEDFPEIVYLNLPSAEELFDSYGNNTNTIRNLNARVAVSEASLTSAQVNNLYPSVSLAMNYNLGGNGYYNSSLTNGFNDAASATLTVSIPLSSYIPGSSGNNAVKNAEDSVAISKINLNAGRANLLSSIRSSLISIEQSRANIEITKTSLDIAQRAYDLANESYNAGTITLSSLQDQADSLSVAELNSINAEASYIQNIYTLAYTLNMGYDDLISLYGESK